MWSAAGACRWPAPRPCAAQHVQAGDHPGRQGDDQLRLGAVVLLAEVRPAVQQPDGLHPTGGLEAGVRVPGAALGVGGVHGHLAGEQALLQGRISLNGHAQLLAGGQQLLLDAAGQQAVLFLNDVQLAVFAVAADELSGGVGRADGTNLALLLELHHGLDSFFQREDGKIRRLPVGVEHVQMVGAETAQAVFHILDDALGRQVTVGLHAVHHLVENGAFVPPLEAALGGEDDLVPVDVAQSLAHHLFAVVKAVDGGGVYPGDALVHGSLDGFTDRASSLSPHQLPPPMAQVPSPRNGAERPLLPMLRFSIDRYLLFRQRPAKGGVVADWYILLHFRFIPKRAAMQVFCTAALGNL